MRRRLIPVVLLATTVVAGCSSGQGADSAPAADGASAQQVSIGGTGEPRTDYLSAVCTAGGARLVFGAHRYFREENDAYSPAEVLATVPDAIRYSQEAAAFLENPGYSWPEEIADQVATVAASEQEIATDLQALYDAGEANYDQAIASYMSRGDGNPWPGRQIREYFDLGAPGDCPPSPFTDRVFVIQVRNLVPSLGGLDDAGILDRGDKVCRALAAAPDSQTPDVTLAELGFFGEEAGVMASTAEEHLCTKAIGSGQVASPSPQPSATSSAPADPRAFVIDCFDGGSFDSFEALYDYWKDETYPTLCSTEVLQPKAFEATADERKAFATQKRLKGETDAYAFETFADYCATDPGGLMEQIEPSVFQAMLLVCPQYPMNGKTRLYVEGSYIPWDGTYEVGTYIQPGVWRSPRDTTDCYWERTSPGGDILDNGLVTNARDGVTVTISASDGSFTTEGCGSWERIG